MGRPWPVVNVCLTIGTNFGWTPLPVRRWGLRKLLPSPSNASFCMLLRLILADPGVPCPRRLPFRPRPFRGAFGGQHKRVLLRTRWARCPLVSPKPKPTFASFTMTFSILATTAIIALWLRTRWTSSPISASQCFVLMLICDPQLRSYAARATKVTLLAPVGFSSTRDICGCCVLTVLRLPHLVVASWTLSAGRPTLRPLATRPCSTLLRCCSAKCATPPTARLLPHGS